MYTLFIRALIILISSRILLLLTLAYIKHPAKRKDSIEIHSVNRKDTYQVFKIMLALYTFVSQIECYHAAEKIVDEAIFGDDFTPMKLKDAVCDSIRERVRRENQSVFFL